MEKQENTHTPHRPKARRLPGRDDDLETSSPVSDGTASDRLAVLADMAFDLVIDVENTPGALASVAAAVSDAGVNLAAATCIGSGERAELHILVPHAEAARHSLAIARLAVTREREVVVVDVEDNPGVLADLARKIANAGVNLDLVYIATRNRVVFGSRDLPALKAALGGRSTE
jgi:hypothetical protein